MKMRFFFAVCLLLGGVPFGADSAAGQSRVDYDYAFIGDPLPDPVMQQNKETFVLYGCAYCHGINLAPVGEAADLRTSAIVAADVDANVIGPILRNGIPQTPKSSPMPQFSDLSEREILAIAAYIHYERARVRYENLTAEPPSAGDAAAGRGYFEQNCASCHSVDRDLAGIGGRYDAVALREQVLEPAPFRTPISFKLDDRNDAGAHAGRTKHQTLLENYAGTDVANVVAYLQTLK